MIAGQANRPCFCSAASKRAFSRNDQCEPRAAMRGILLGAVFFVMMRRVGVGAGVAVGVGETVVVFLCLMVTD